MFKHECTDKMFDLIKVNAEIKKIKKNKCHLFTFALISNVYKYKSFLKVNY